MLRGINSCDVAAVRRFGSGIVLSSWDRDYWVDDQVVEMVMACIGCNTFERI
jgi:hypothetical protein